MTRSGPPRRIASLLASGTEIVSALGLEDRLVAISHECDYPPDVLDRPRISRVRFDASDMDSGAIDRAVREAMAEHGSVYAVDGDALERLRPDLVLTQAVCEVCAVPTPGVRDVLAERELEAEVLSLDAHTLAEVLASIEAVGRAAGVDRAAHALVEGLGARLERVSRAVAGATHRPRALALEWLDPPFAPGHWVPEMVERAGGENLLGAPGAPSHEVSWAALEGMDPDVLLVMPCGYGLDASAEDAERHGDRLAALAPRALENGGVWVLDGSAYFNRSGPRAVEGVEILAGILHPGLWPAPRASVAARWKGPGA